MPVSHHVVQYAQTAVRVYNTTFMVNDSGNTSIGRSDKPAPVLKSAHLYHLQMLQWSAEVPNQASLETVNKSQYRWHFTRGIWISCLITDSRPYIVSTHL